MPFDAEQIERQATITLNGSISEVWPLFDPINESLWKPHSQPELLYPAYGTVRERMVFRTSDAHAEGKSVWVVSRYDASNHDITYTVVTRERTFVVDVQCSASADSVTEATVTYSFVGLSELGNTLSAKAADALFASDLRDWESAINEYLESRGSAHGGGR